MSDDDQRVIDALMAAQRKNRKIIPCPECKRLQSLLDAANEMEADREVAFDILLQEIKRLRAALERIAGGCDLSNEAQAIAREALRDE